MPVFKGLKEMSKRNMKTYVNWKQIMDSFRILGSLSILLVASCLLAGCSQSKQESGDSPVVRTDSGDGEKVASQQERAVPSQVTKTMTETSDVKISDEPVQSGPNSVPSSGKISDIRPDELTTFKQKNAASLSIDELREKLVVAENPDAVVKATDLIGRLRGQGRAALPDLIKLTADADPRVRWHAARSIGLIGEDAVSSIPVLLSLLQDADPVVATQAAAAIGHIREDDDHGSLSEVEKELYADAVTQLVGTLVHNDARVRRACLRSLQSLNPAPEQLMPIVDAVFASQDPATILPVMESIADMGGEAVPFLIDRLKLPQGRFWASVAITEIGPSAAGATQALIEALSESALDEQLHEIFALASIGEGAQSAGEALVTLYSDGDSSLQGPILYAIGKLKFRDAESLLMQIVSEETPLSATAAWALAKIKPDAPALVKDAVERMRAQCQSESVFERAAAASALSDLSISLEVQERQNLGVHLQSMLLDDSEQVQEAAAAAIVRLGGDGVPAVAIALENLELRFFALGITSAIGEPAAKLVPAIVELLDSGDSDLVQEAIFALAAIGSPSAVASGQILAILNESVSSEDEEARLHYAATYCLGRIGSLAGQGVLPRLKELSGSPDLMQATVAVWSILQIAPNDQEQSLNAVPLLMRALNSENQTVRLEATIALGDLGSIAEDAIPAIELVSEDDPVRTIRQAAKESLRRIQAE